MQLSDLRNLLQGVPNTAAITSRNKSQMFGLCDASEKVSIFALEYSIEMKSRERVDTVAPALIFDGFRERDDLKGDRYLERKDSCLAIHDVIRNAGYQMVSAVWHAHSQGDMLRCEYYKSSGDGWIGSSLFVVYSPTDYMPDGCAVVWNKHHTDKLDGVYYTPGYEEGQLTYVGVAEMDGRPVRTVDLSFIEGKVWYGDAMFSAWRSQVDGFGLSRVTSMTQSESQEGWKREYTGNLWKELGGYAVQVVIQNYHFSN